MRAEIVVVGGGPAGLYAAQLLARSGLAVRVLEEHDRIGDPVHCTGILGTEAFALPGVPRDVVLGRPSVACFHSPVGYRLVYRHPDGDVSVIDRGAFDRALAQTALEAGAEITTGARALGLKIEGDRVMVDAVIAGEPHSVSAEVCLLACGASYRFQRELGWGMPPLLFGSAQTELPATPDGMLNVFLRSDVAPTGFAWLVPVTRNGVPRAKAGVMASTGARRVLGQLLDELTTTGQVSLPPLGPVVARLLPLSPLARTYGDRVLALGDAAGLVKPTTGGGIYYSLLSARWAATTLQVAFDKGDFSASALAGYEDTWRAYLGLELKVGLWFRRLVRWLTPSDLDALTMLAITDGLMPVVRASARFNWHHDLIMQTLRHRGVLQIVVRRLLEILMDAGLHHCMGSEGAKRRDVALAKEL